jgi:hypothetical protein
MKDFILRRLSSKGKYRILSGIFHYFGLASIYCDKSFRQYCVGGVHMEIWQKLMKFWEASQGGAKSKGSLAEIIDQARLEWLAAQNYYKTATDPDLIDYSIFLTKAYERRYMYLLKKARQEGLRHPDGISLSGITDAGTIRQLF